MREVLRWGWSEYPIYVVSFFVGVLLLCGLLVWGVVYIHAGCPDNFSEQVQVCIPRHGGGFICHTEWRRISGCFPR